MGRHATDEKAPQPDPAAAAPRALLTMREMTERTGLSVDTLRYYERMGLLRPVARDPQSRHRRFSEQDCCDLAFVQVLRETAMPLEQIRQVLALLRQPRDTARERAEILYAHEQAVEARLARMQGHLGAIRRKIEKCRSEIRPEGNDER